jgi:TonB family protein
MMTEPYRKHMAALVSVTFHVVVFGVLAASGLFTFLQSHAQTPVDVSVYNEDSLRDEAGPIGGGTAGGGGVETVEMASALPAISETYTQEVEKEREVKKLTAQGMDQQTAEQKASNGSNDSTDSQQKGDPTKPLGSGDTDGAGNDRPPGAGNSQGKQPPKKAVLVGRPSDFRSYMPEELKEKGVHGSISVSLTIGTSGAVSVTITGPSPYAALNAAAEQFFSQYSYEPATDENGQPVEAVKSASITY